MELLKRKHFPCLYPFLKTVFESSFFKTNIEHDFGIFLKLLLLSKFSILCFSKQKKTMNQICFPFFTYSLSF